MFREKDLEVFRGSLKSKPDTELAKLFNKLSEDKRTDTLDDHTRAMAGAKAVIVEEEIRLRTLRKKYLG